MKIRLVLLFCFSFFFSSFVFSQTENEPEIIEFDEGEDFPIFYNNLVTEVEQGGSGSRYHLLKGLHELAQLVESSDSNSLKQFLVSLGIEDSILNFSLADSPLAGTFEFELNRGFQTGEIAEFVQNGFIPRLQAIDSHFAQVTATVTMDTDMTGAEEDVIADATDIKVLRSMVNLLAGLASIQSAYNWDYNAGDLEDLDEEITETSLQEVRENHPNLFGVQSVPQLQNAKAFIQSAINVYQTASTELRASGRYATQSIDPDYLFVLDENDFEDEAEFKADLLELLDALSQNHTITDDDEYSGMVISLSAFFNGGLDFPTLLPNSIGDQFSNDQLTDPTIGGILPNATYANSEFLQDLREEFYKEEWVYGQPVRHDSLEDAIASFDYITYLHLNPDLDDWYQIEANARMHFSDRGFRDKRRYFYYPYEVDRPVNYAASSLSGHKSLVSGTFPDLNNYQFNDVHYYLDESTVVIHDLVSDTWTKNKYFYRRTAYDSASVTIIGQNGEKTITEIAYTDSENSGSEDHVESGTIVVSMADPTHYPQSEDMVQGSGTWQCTRIDLSEIPTEYQLEDIEEDFAPADIAIGSGDAWSAPSLKTQELDSSYIETVDLRTEVDYGGYRQFNASVVSDRFLDDAPESLSGLKANFYSIETLGGSGNAKFYDTNLTLITYSNEVLGEEGYEYEKTGEKTGILRLNNGTWVGELVFNEWLDASGEYTEIVDDDTQTGEFSINFEKIGESPETLIGMNGSLNLNPTDKEHYQVTLGEYTLENDEYVYTGTDRTIDNNYLYPTFGGVVPADEHDNQEHFHYYAVTDVNYYPPDWLSWTEFGPALDAPSAVQMYNNNDWQNSVYYSATNYDYRQVGDVYLKITNSVLLNPWLEDYDLYEHINEISEYDSLTTGIWDEELQTDVLTTHGYEYVKTGEETGLLTLAYKYGSVGIELKFSDFGQNAHGSNELNMTTPEGNRVTLNHNINLHNSKNTYGEFSYTKLSKNNAILSTESRDWTDGGYSLTQGSLYYLYFTDKNRGTYVKYTDYITETDVVTGEF